MSKTPVITKNSGTDWSDSVDKLRTNLLGGGSAEWLPEDEAKGSTLDVTANGTYSAASAGKYGYNYVTVSVPGNVVSGTGPDGKEHAVTVDPDTGGLVDQVIPSRIEVTTPPTVTSYTDGDTINFSGLVVHAYDSDGVDMGEVTFGELVFPVTEAEAGPQEEQNIPVHWPRTGDGAVLETSFVIRVQSASS